MSKYELELSDDQAESLAKVLEYAVTPGDLSGFSSDLALSAASRLREQIPIPVPVKVGAVVRTTMDVFVRRIGNDNRDRVWWRVPDGDWLTNEEIGRITEVLSPGVDL